MTAVCLKKKKIRFGRDEQIPFTKHHQKDLHFNVRLTWFLFLLRQSSIVRTIVISPTPDIRSRLYTFCVRLGGRLDHYWRNFPVRFLLLFEKRKSCCWRLRSYNITPISQQTSGRFITRLHTDTHTHSLQCTKGESIVKISSFQRNGEDPSWVSSVSFIRRWTFGWWYDTLLFNTVLMSISADDDTHFTRTQIFSVFRTSTVESRFVCVWASLVWKGEKERQVKTLPHAVFLDARMTNRRPECVAE